MIAVEFVELVEASKPNAADLEEFGLDESEIEEIHRTFRCPKRKESIAISGAPESALTQLLGDYDCSHLEIGLVRFHSNALISKFGWHFADCESEQIVLTQDGKIILVDSEKLRLECAANGSSFLRGLGEFVGIRSRKSEWKGHVLDAARECAKAAGGERYLEFFSMLCSFLR